TAIARRTIGCGRFAAARAPSIASSRTSARSPIARAFRSGAHLPKTPPRVLSGRNFDEPSGDSFPALLDFISEQEFADKLVKVNFKPIVRDQPPPAPTLKGMLPLVPVSEHGKPLGGSCMTSVGGGGGSTCDGCSFLDEKMAFLREETRRRGLPGPS